MGIARRVVLIAVVALVVAAPAASGVGQSAVLHVLVAKVTWGPQPFSDGQVDVALKAAASFYQTGSFGKVSLSYDQTPWLDVLAEPPSCTMVGSLTLASRLAPLVAAAGYQLGSYNRLVFLLPAANCEFAGNYEPAGIVLNGQLTAGLVVHELGHSLGIGHAGAVRCRYNAASVRFCQSDVYGDPWDVMSANIDMNGDVSGLGGDFGALQKARAGWLTSITHVQSAGVYTLGALEQETRGAQALVIQTAGYQYWVDHREALGNDAYLASDRNDVTSGFEVHREVGDPDLTQNQEYPLIPDYLLPQGRRNRYITAPGQSFTLPNVFELTALSHANEQMTIRFRWLDHTHPAAPDVAAASTGSTVTLTWPPARDIGTGVKDYLVSDDDGPPTALAAQPPTHTYTEQLTGLSPGRHTITVTATDYAGNRSLATTRTISVR